jgi:endonuclease I/membrane-bound metal-dependent hydrolase YbcI (DUF457 family)
MPRRPSRRPVTGRASIAARVARGRPTRIVWLGLVTSLTLLTVLVTVPARLTQDWPPPAQHAAARLQGLAAPWIARLRTLQRDLWHVPAPVPSAEPPPTTAPARRPRAAPAPATVPESAPPAVTLPHVAASFSAAKRLLYDRVDAGHWIDFYCGCPFDAAHHPDDLDACGLATLAGTKRAQRIEIDHVFPAAQFGQARPCWRDPAAFPACAPSGARPLSGRQCCEKVDPPFATASRDLVNLVPAVGALNGRRSDFNWGLIDRGTGEQFGTCALRIDLSIRRVESPHAVRGTIARILFYMRGRKLPTVLSHPAVPLALAAIAGRSRISGRLLLAGVVASALPDADVLAFRLGIAYASEFGHRGFSHSLLFAAVVAAIAAVSAPLLKTQRYTAASFVGLACASHGLLDMLTTGGHGVAYFWPFSDERFFFPTYPSRFQRSACGGSWGRPALRCWALSFAESGCRPSLWPSSVSASVGELRPKSISLPTSCASAYTIDGQSSHPGRPRGRASGAMRPHRS